MTVIAISILLSLFSYLKLRNVTVPTIILVVGLLLSDNVKSQATNHVFTATSASTFAWAAPYWVKISDTAAELAPYLRTGLVTSSFLTSILINAYATPANSIAFTNKTGNISMWTNDASYLTTSRTISTTSPLAGGGDLSANRTLTIANGKADNSTKGAVTMDSSYFNDDGAGLISFSATYGTGSVSANAVTVNTPRGKITYTSPSISAGTVVAVTFTNSFITSTSTILIGLNGNGSNLTAVTAYVKSQTAGSCIVNVSNLSLLNLFNTTFLIDYLIVN